jgi:transposase
MFNYDDYKILLACGTTDMRKNINGLCEIVLNHFELDPREKIMFAFCNSARNRVKVLVWEDNGFWVHFKRLEKGSIPWPDVSTDEITMNLSIAEFKNIIISPRIKKKLKRQKVW